MIVTAWATILCFRCGLPFQMPMELKEQRLLDKEYFWCPNGHEQHYLGEKPEVALQRALTIAQNKISCLTGERARLEKDLECQKGQNTRLRKKIQKENSGEKIK